MSCWIKYKSACLRIACFFCLFDFETSVAASVSYENAQRQLDGMLSYLAGRALSETERGQITDEFLGFFQQKANCVDACEDALRVNQEAIDYMRDHPHEPRANIIRHRFTLNSYFIPIQHGTLIQRLIAEGDPILAVDKSSQRLLTEKGVKALIRLLHWTQVGGAPQDIPIEKQAMEEAVVLIRNRIGGQVEMPPMWNFSMALWTGFKQEWPNLSESERNHIKSFILEPNHTSISADMLRRLLNISHKEATELESVYRITAASARWSETHQRFMGLMGKAMGIQGIQMGLGQH